MIVEHILLLSENTHYKFALENRKQSAEENI